MQHSDVSKQGERRRVTISQRSQLVGNAAHVVHAGNSRAQLIAGQEDAVAL